jgi:lipopolysaccharide biosynthesis regulator YciM
LIGLEYFQTAEQVVTAALERSPTDALLQTAEGDVKQAKGDAAGSMQSYERIIASHPGFAPAMIGMARASASQGNDQRAVDTLRTVLSRDPANADANGELGSIELQRNEWKAALEHLNRAWAEDQANSRVALELARALAGVSRPEEALKLIMSLPADVRSSRGAHIALEKIYMQLHRDTDADAERAALRLEAQRADTLRFTNPGTYVY